MVEATASILRTAAPRARTDDLKKIGARPSVASYRKDRRWARGRNYVANWRASLRRNCAVVTSVPLMQDWKPTV